MNGVSNLELLDCLRNMPRYQPCFSFCCSRCNRSLCAFSSTSSCELLVKSRVEESLRPLIYLCKRIPHYLDQVRVHKVQDLVPPRHLEHDVRPNQILSTGITRVSRAFAAKNEYHAHSKLANTRQSLRGFWCPGRIAASLPQYPCLSIPRRFPLRPCIVCPV